MSKIRGVFPLFLATTFGVVNGKLSYAREAQSLAYHE
jgi:hypothetical protein